MNTTLIDHPAPAGGRHLLAQRARRVADDVALSLAAPRLPLSEDDRPHGGGQQPFTRLAP